MKYYSNEHNAQIDFYNSYLKLIDRELKIDDLLIENTDGILGDVLIEMKLNITDLNSVVFQAVKYLSKLRLKGMAVPSSFILISLNSGVAYMYKSEKFRSSIEQIYVGSASRENFGFISLNEDAKWNYKEKVIEQANMIDYLKESVKRMKEGRSIWFPVNIDKNNIVGWASTYYKQNKNATKASFLGDEGIIGEIRRPSILEGFIKPYLGETNIQFGYLMDKLNDNFQKKDLGAFFTPPQYAELSHKFVYEAIRRHQKSGNKDYVIIDRCAGTGNLQEELNNNVPLDIVDKDILSHVILNTYEYYEYKVLLERLGDKVRYINPPIENDDTYMNGLVRGSNALSEEFIENEYINQYVNDPDCTIIIFENPPYAETTSIQHQKAGKSKNSSSWKNDRGTIEAKKVLKGAQSNDIANVFIWTACEYYLKKPEDSMIVFSPLKYWKNGSWMNKKFESGLALNRRHFHTKADTVVSCILWSNEEQVDQKEIKLRAYDIIDEEVKLIKENLPVHRVFSTYSKHYYDKRNFDNDVLEKFENGYRDVNAILCKKNGDEIDNNQTSIRAIGKYNENIIGYMMTKSNTFENPRLQTNLTRQAIYDANGFYLRKDNFQYKLPMFAAGWWSSYNNDWTLNGVIYRTADGHKKFNKEVAENKNINAWLCKVAFYSSLEYYNKVKSFQGSDGRLYLNELCLDNTLGDTHLLTYLQNNKFFENMSKKEKTLFDLWNKILTEIKETKKYNKNINYGPFQIQTDLNTYKKVRQGTREKTVYDYPSLNGNLRTLRLLIKEYYLENIVDGLYKYEFIK